MASMSSIPPRPTFGLGAVLAILFAVGGLFASCGGHPIWGLILGILALPLGAIGLMMSVAPGIRGGVVSIGALVLGVLGIVVAILAIAFHIILWPFRW